MLTAAAVGWPKLFQFGWEEWGEFRSEITRTAAAVHRGDRNDRGGGVSVDTGNE